MSRDKRDTFRFIRVRFVHSLPWSAGKLYAYRCDFLVQKGDVLRVPTANGDAFAEVVNTSADKCWDHPYAKWAIGFRDGCRPLIRWPRHFRVRPKENQGRLP